MCGRGSRARYLLIRIFSKGILYKVDQIRRAPAVDGVTSDDHRGLVCPCRKTELSNRSEELTYHGLGPEY